MFVRIIKASSNEYAVILRSYRDKDGKVRQKTIQNLGVVTNKNREELLAIGRRIIAKHNDHEIISSIDNIKELNRANWGSSAIINSLWSTLSLDSLFNKNYINPIKLMLAERLIAPCSKLRTYHRRNYHDELFKDLKLHQLYRALDALADNEHKIKDNIMQRQLSRAKVDMVLFDVTTLYFESQKKDDFKNFGYSKDCKFNEVQVVLSLIIDTQGRPLSYEVFPGNTYEGNTLLPVVQRVKSKHKINKVIVVADRGIGSKTNLDLLKEQGFDYIIGAKLRSMSKAIQQQAISMQGYEENEVTNNGDKHITKYKTIKEEAKQLMVFYSPKRAEKDAKDRVRLVEKAQQLLTKKTSEKGANKYIVTTKSESKLNQKKIDEDALYDGYYGLHFSNTEMSWCQITQAYAQLWRIEESFRTIKHLFELRPMFHWTEKRIKGHIMLNFILLVIEKEIMLRLKASNVEATHVKVRDAISEMEKSVLSINGDNYEVYAKLSSLQKSILKANKIQVPKNSRI